MDRGCYQESDVAFGKRWSRTACGAYSPAQIQANSTATGQYAGKGKDITRLGLTWDRHQCFGNARFMILAAIVRCFQGETSCNHLLYW